MSSVIISALGVVDNEIEVVERKGLGHPDTMCDALAETLSRNLCHEYRERFGEVLHHNVDKALLRAGRAAPAFGGGTILEPIDIYLAGRAVTEIARKALQVDEIAIEGSKAWLRKNLPSLNADRHVRIHSLIRPGSHELQELFSRRPRSDARLANDTSVGVGYAPMSALERLVLAIEKRINTRDRSREHQAWGPDVKVMGIRRGNAVSLTVACAMIGRYLSDMDVYLEEKAAIEALAHDLAIQHGFTQCAVIVNTADDPKNGAIYLTVTGTSAEAGDDGQVGRGNRVNGLITPYRPMSLEAVAGKNPVTHVGKIYNVLAHRIAAVLVTSEPDIEAAQCLLASRIGAPIEEPELFHIRLAMRERSSIDRIKDRAEQIARAQITAISELVEGFIDGTIDAF